MRAYVKAAVLAFAAATTACSGSPSTGGIPVAAATSNAPPQSKSASATFSLTIPRSAASAARLRKAHRTRQYVSYGTNGISVAVYATGADPSSAIVTDYDVSANSSICPFSGTQGTGTQQCTLSIPAPIGNDTFVITTYDNASAQGVPSGSVLSTGSGTATIVQGQTNSVNVVLGEVVSSVSFVPPRTIALGSQETSSPLYVSLNDAAGDSPEPDDTNPLAAPVKIAIVESGNGSGQSELTHTVFSVNGGYGHAFVTIAKPADVASIAVDYDGQAAIGYVATLFATVPSKSDFVIGVGQVDPLFITSSSSLYGNGGIVFTGAGQSVTLALNIADLADPAFPYTLTAIALGCDNVASTADPTSGTSPSVTITSVGTSGSCRELITFNQQFFVGGGENIGTGTGFIVPISVSM